MSNDYKRFNIKTVLDFILFILILILLTVSSKADTIVNNIDPERVIVIDGDTIKINNVSYRLMGYDTPETKFAKCENKKVLGLLATRRLQELLLSAKSIKLHTKDKDKYKRVLALLELDNKDVSNIMINEGYATPYNGKAKRRNWCD